MESRIDHKAIQEKWQNIWATTNAFDSTVDNTSKSYVICQAPPNITNKVHMGHFLNGTLNDVIARKKRQEGYKVCFRAGLDHAGLATQIKVESWLKSQDLTKEMLGKEKFLEECVKWKDKYGDTIIEQFKAIGLSCDWNHVTFTLDPNYSEKVIETFVKLYKAGYIYKGNYLVNWCSALETAISDEECIEKEEVVKVYYIKYQIENSQEYISVATTRPETLFGDVAVAYNPNDPRYTHLEGKYVLIPIINKKIPLIADESISIEFGTGLCKITPAHNKNDYAIAQKYNLEPVTIFDKKGRLINTGTKYDTMKKTAAREAIIHELMYDLNAFELEKLDIKKSIVTRCSRSNCMIEPMISSQYFIRMKELAESTLELIDTQQVQFVPAKVENLYRSWIAGIKDWCVSRQIWYSHTIPVWYCENDHLNCCCVVPESCETCGSTNLTQETDCLDTWASSYIWQFATFNNEEFKRYYPIDLIVSGQDILFFWIMRMMITSKFLHNCAPFKRVLFHGIVRDEIGKKMSKSAGNGVDPIDIVNKYGIDPMRFGILMKLPKEGDLRLTEDIIKIGTRFCTKLWNIGRHFKLHNICFHNQVQSYGNLTIESSDDTTILEKLSKLTDDVNNCYEKLDTHELTTIIYNFTWNEFANDYLESTKTDLTENKKRILSYVYFCILHMLHPIIPHVTSELIELIY